MNLVSLSYLNFIFSAAYSLRVKLNYFYLIKQLSFVLILFWQCHGEAQLILCVQTHFMNPKTMLLWYHSTTTCSRLNHNTGSLSHVSFRHFYQSLL